MLEPPFWLQQHLMSVPAARLPSGRLMCNIVCAARRAPSIPMGERTHRKHTPGVMPSSPSAVSLSCSGPCVALIRVSMAGRVLSLARSLSVSAKGAGIVGAGAGVGWGAGRPAEPSWCLLPPPSLSTGQCRMKGSGSKVDTCSFSSFFLARWRGGSS